MHPMAWTNLAIAKSYDTFVKYVDIHTKIFGWLTYT